MRLNETIIEILNLLPEDTSLKKEESEVEIVSNDKILVRFTDESMKLAGSIDLSDKLVENSERTSLPNFPAVRDFFDMLGDSFIRLNHVGISYFCKDIEKEIINYQTTLEKTPFRLYEEISEDPYQKWFFAGNISDWTQPLCEIVFNTNPTPAYKYWHPQIQIDIDTKLSIEDLDRITLASFGKNIWQWKIDIPNYGVVLAMGLLGNIQGVKLALGVGTNLRGTQYHREKLLQEVS